MTTISHGTWHKVAPKFGTFQHWENEAGDDWYEFQKRVENDGKCFVLVVDGAANMIADHISKIIPHMNGEVLEVSADTKVEHGWRRQGDGFVSPPPRPPVDPVDKLKAFLAANPDVRAHIGA